MPTGETAEIRIIACSCVQGRTWGRSRRSLTRWTLGQEASLRSCTQHPRPAVRPDFRDIFYVVHITSPASSPVEERQSLPTGVGPTALSADLTCFKTEFLSKDHSAPCPEVSAETGERRWTSVGPGGPAVSWDTEETAPGGVMRAAHLGRAGEDEAPHGHTRSLLLGSQRISRRFRHNNTAPLG